MKIYFCGSIRGGRDHQEIYFDLIKHIQTFGQVLTEHVGCKELDSNGKVTTDTALTDKEIHDRDISWLNESDFVVAEVTMPSLGVGYELGHAYLLNKPTLCLFRDGCDKNLSAMIGGAVGSKSPITVKHYTAVNEAKEEISVFLNKKQ